MRSRRSLSLLALAGLLAASPAASATQQPVPAAPIPQSLDDAWWTGSMLAPSAATLPRGHWLFEPYFFDVGSSQFHTAGSLAYINYGLFGRLTVGLIPTFYFNVPSAGGPALVRPAFGDVSLQAQFGISTFHPGHRMPSIAINLQESLPTGQYDHLDGRPSAGFGSGAFTTTLSLFTQDYFWLPTGRILRLRANVSQSVSGTASVAGASVYGTVSGFDGVAMPGESTYFDVAGEYSLTRRWVGALDLTYRHTAATWVVPDLGQASNFGSSDAFAVAPAIEYNLSPNLGVLFGVRRIPSSHNTTASFTPVLAINLVH